MKTTVDDAAGFMTPGSVWLREDGSKNVLLFVTNTSLPAKVQAAFPPQAVYLDEEGNVLNRSVEDFVSKRTFFNVVAEIEVGVDQLLAYRDLDAIDEDADDGEDDEAIDDELLIAGGDLTADAEGEEDLGDEEMFASRNQDMLVVLDAPESLQGFAAELEQAIVGYRQEPILSHSLMAHVLIIDTDRLDASVDEIVAAFDPDKEFQIDSFSVRGMPKVTWDTFVGAYNQMTDKKYHIAVYLGCSMDIDSGQSTLPKVDAEVAAIEAALATETEGAVELESTDPIVITPAATAAAVVAAEVLIAPAVAEVAPVVVAAPSVVVG